MKPEYEILRAALSCDTPEERNAYIRRACENDPGLLEKVEALIAEGSANTGSLQPTDSGKSSTGEFVPRSPYQTQKNAQDNHENNLIAERYEVLEQLGRGGMGVVYKVRERSIKRVVALKMIVAGEFASEHQLARFQTEAAAVAALKHSNVVPLYEYGTHRGFPYFTQEFMEGGSLAQKIKHSPPGALQSARLLEQIARGVAAAHARGIVHRDLKPENILLTSDGIPKVADFGLAKQISLDQGGIDDEWAELGTGGFTIPGAIVGTPSYMAPEQALGKRSVGPAVDIWALGAILYRLLTGRAPFLGPTPGDTIEQVIETEPIPPRAIAARIPRDLETICLRCLRKKETGRYESAEQLADDLQRFLNRRPILARPAGRIERSWKWIRRNPAIASSVFGIFLSLVLGTLVAVYFAVQADRGEKEARKQQEEAKKQAQEAAVQTGIANDQTTKALALQKIADANGSDAAEQGKLTLEMLRVLIDDVLDQLKDIPGQQELRKQVLTKTVASLQKLGNRAEISARANHEQIWVHLELGDIFLEMGTDGTQEAKKQYQRAHALASKLAQQSGAASEAQRDLSAALNKLSGIQVITGDIPAALESCRQSIQIASARVQHKPNDRESQRDLSIGYSKLGALQLESGRTQEALTSFRRSLEIDKSLAKRYPDETQSQYDLCVALNNLGQAQMRAGDSRAARELLERSLQLSEQLGQKEPGRFEFRHNRAVVFQMMSSMHSVLGDTKAAADFCQRSLATLEQIAREEPRRSKIQRDLSNALIQMGELQKRTDVAAARASFQRALDIRSTLAQADPGNTQAQQDLALAWERLADIDAQTKQASPALAGLQRSLEIQERLTRQDPNNTENQRGYALALERMGALQYQIGAARAALASFEKCLGVRDKLAKSDTKNADAQRDLSVALEWLGRVHLRLGETNAALGVVKRSLEIREKLAAADPGNIRARRDLAVALEKVGVVTQAMFQFKEAASWFRKSVELVRQLPDPKALDLDATFAETRLRICLAADRALDNPATAVQEVPEIRLLVLREIMNALLFEKKLDKAVQAAELLGGNAKTALDCYHAATGLARCAALAGGADQKEMHARRALQFLRDAISKGYKNPVQLKEDPALEALRNREEFKQLLRDLAQ